MTERYCLFRPIRVDSLSSVAVTLLILLLAAARADANTDDVITSITEGLPYDENGKLASHVLVYPAGDPNCAAAHASSSSTETNQEHYGFEFYGLKGDAVQAVFPGASDDTCWAACLELGTDKSVAHAVMPYRRWPGLGNFLAWFKNTCQKTEVCLINYHSRQSPIKVFWVPSSDSEQQQGNRRQQQQKRMKQVEIKYGEKETKCFSTFIGHNFEVEDGETGEILETMKIEYTTTRAIGVSPPSGNPTGRLFEKEIHATLRNEWKRHNKVTRTFSPLGFMKGRLPDDIFASMGSFYYNNRYDEVNEEWETKGYFVNWWESNVSFIMIPWLLKTKWQFRLKELVEAWAGVPVEQTAMYGLRQYEEGARLLTHVHRVETHAVSLIVNIHQENLSRPWPVEVHDHGNRMHELTMEPGEIIYYESAKCLHGRNRPLSGINSIFVNLFTHYRPLKDPEWYTKPRDEDAPAPIVDVEGECHVERVPTAETESDQPEYVKRVRCTDKRLGDFVSPTLIRAYNADDLIEWWQRAAEEEEDGGPPVEERVESSSEDGRGEEEGTPRQEEDVATPQDKDVAPPKEETASHGGGSRDEL